VGDELFCNSIFLALSPFDKASYKFHRRGLFERQLARFLASKRVPQPVWNLSKLWERAAGKIELQKEFILYLSNIRNQKSLILYPSNVGNQNPFPDIYLFFIAF